MHKTYPGYDTKPSDDEASVRDLLGMWSTPSLLLLSGLLLPGEIVPIRDPIYGSNRTVKPFNCVQTND